MQNDSTSEPNIPAPAQPVFSPDAAQSQPAPVQPQQPAPPADYAQPVQPAQDFQQQSIVQPTAPPADPAPAPVAAQPVDAPAPAAQPEPSLYDKLGQTAGISAVVNRLYDLIAQDPRLAPYFSESGMPRQGLTDFVVAITGGPTAPGYSAPDLAAVHQQYGITHEDFMQVGAYLKQAMEEVGVAPDVVDTVMSVVVGTHDQVVAAVAQQSGQTPDVQQPPVDPATQAPVAPPQQ